MIYDVIYTETALKDLKRIPKKTAKRIYDKVHFFKIQKNPLQFAKKLNNSKYGGYRFRVGDYRVLFDLDERNNLIILFILSVRHRKEAYKC